MRGFRAWHKKLNRYLEPHEFYITPIGEVATACFTTLDGEVITVNSIEDFSCDDFEEGLVILEEDTGLKDKNSKEIYEGDIVRYAFDYPKGEWVEEVSFGKIADGEGYYHDYFLAWRTIDSNGDGAQSLLDLEGVCEVIGNIHENPELLEGKE